MIDLDVALVGQAPSPNEAFDADGAAVLREDARTSSEVSLLIQLTPLTHHGTALHKQPSTQ